MIGHAEATAWLRRAVATDRLAHAYLAFTHEKPVFTQPRLALTRLLYPPYRKRFDVLLKILKKLA